MNDQDFDNVINDGVRFLDSITRYYGADKGIEVWESMGEAMGTDVKGKIFFRMLTGGSSDRVDIERGTAENAVWAIKAIRTGTGASLKEAKDAWDRCATHKVTLRANNPDARREMVRTLRDMGMNVG